MELKLSAFVRAQNEYHVLKAVIFTWESNCVGGNDCNRVRNPGWSNGDGRMNE